MNRPPPPPVQQISMQRPLQGQMSMPNKVNMPPRMGGPPAVQSASTTNRIVNKPAVEAPPVSELNCIEMITVGISWFFTVLFFPITVWWCYKVIREYERAILFRMGKIRKGARGPGSFFILPCTDEFYVLDLRTVTYDVPPQEVLTRDSVTVQVDAVVFYRVFDPVIAVQNVQNYNSSTQLLATSILRNVLGTKTLKQLLSDREGISDDMRQSLDEATDPWGVKVERVEFKDVRLPQQLYRAMAAEAEAAREAKAKIVAAEGEMQASSALKDASTVLGQSPGALQLRYLQTLSAIAAEKNYTIIFPLPLEVLRKW